VSERDFTPEEIEAFEELAERQDTDPALFERIVQEGFEDAERKEHGEHVLGMIENATQHRQERDRALLDAIFRPAPSGAEGPK
jgi:hypothetical protein